MTKIILINDFIQDYVLTYMLKNNGSDTTVGKHGSPAKAWWWNLKIFFVINQLIINILEQF